MHIRQKRLAWRAQRFIYEVDIQFGMAVDIYVLLYMYMWAEC